MSDSDDASDDSDSDEVNAILGEEEQDGDSSDKLLKEIKVACEQVHLFGYQLSRVATPLQASDPTRRLPNIIEWTLQQESWLE